MWTLKLDWFDILAPAVGALAWLLLSWSFARSVNMGRPLKAGQRAILACGLWFVLGMGYSMAVVAMLGWPRGTWIPMTIFWAALIGFIAWRRHMRNKRLASEEDPKIPARAYVSVGMPFLGVLISLIVSAIQWEFVAEGQGHLWQALAWTAALAASIWLARQNRRVAVVMALRVFLVLGVIGAIGHPSIAVFVALGVAATVYFLIGRLWPKDTDPPVLDFEALSRGWRGWRRP